MPFSRAGLGPLAIVRQRPRSLTIAADAHSSQIKRTARTRLKGGRGHEARRAPSARQPHGFASGDKRGAAVLLI